MKISLVNAGRNISYAVTPPVNLAILAAVLEQDGHEVRIVDEFIGHNIRGKIKEFNPDLVGITGTTPLISAAYRDADIIREMGYRVAIGGVHASILPEEALKHADIAVVGEGENAIKTIVKDPKLSGIIKGEAVMNLDDIPSPSWHLLDMNYYTSIRQRLDMSFLSFAHRDSKVGVILSSRGCPFRCTFCWNSFRSLPYRFNSAKRVVDDMESLNKNYNVTSIFFIEDNLFCNKPRLIEICKLIKDRGLDIVWGGNSRTDNLDKETLLIAKDAGCKQVTFGFESGSQRILNILNKKNTVEQNAKAIKLCNEVGVLANGTFMIGNPTETEEDIEMTRKFIEDNNIDGGIGICITTPFPGTELWKWCESNNKIPKNLDWYDFDYHNVVIPVTDIPMNRFLELHENLVRLAISKYNGTKRRY